MLSRRYHRTASALLISLLLAVTNLGLVGPISYTAHADSPTSIYFPQTNQTLQGVFLQYWQSHGGLPVYGYPITDEHPEVNPADGQTYTVQWFERNRFEYHPENATTHPDYVVELGLLGSQLTADRVFPPASDKTNTPGQTVIYFPQTQHNLRNGFLDYWQSQGGLDRFGYPISEEHNEYNPSDGKCYVTQWFQRARFEYHPEVDSKQFRDQVELGLLGDETLKNPHPALPTPNDAWTVYSTTNSDFGSNLFRAGAVESNGDLWFGTGGYLLHYDGGYWRCISAVQNASSIAIDRNNVKWVGTTGTTGDFGVTKIDTTEQTTQAFSINSGALSSYDVRSIAADRFSGSIWIGTADQDANVGKFDGKAWTNYNSSNSGIGDGVVNAVAVDNNGLKWFGTGGRDDDGVHVFDENNGSWQSYPIADIRSLAVDNNNNIWAGTDQGIARYDHNSWTYYNTKNANLPGVYGPGGEYVSSIAFDKNGVLWATFANSNGNYSVGGLARFDGKSWSFYNTNNSGLPSNNALFVTIDSNNTKWIGTDQGLAKFRGA